MAGHRHIHVRQGWTRESLSWVKLDLANPDSIRTAAKAIAACGRIDVLINNAGITDTEDRDKMSMSALSRTLEVNLMGEIDVTEQLLPAINPGGHIVLLGSALGSISGVTSSYTPAYSFRRRHSECTRGNSRYSWRAKKITVSIVNPGWVKTDMGGRSAPSRPEEAADEIFRLGVVEPAHRSILASGQENGVMNFLRNAELHSDANSPHNNQNNACVRSRWRTGRDSNPRYRYR